MKGGNPLGMVPNGLGQWFLHFLAPGLTFKNTLSHYATADRGGKDKF